MWVKRLRAVAGVEGARDGIGRVDVDADIEGVLLFEPGRHCFEKSSGNSLSAMLVDGVDPFELSVALIAAGEVTGDESYDLLFVFCVDCDEGDAGCESLLGGVFSREIAADAVLPVGFGAPSLRADGGHCGNV